MGPKLTETTNSHFEKVREIIAEYSGKNLSSIMIDSDLSRDLGISGDDGHELFARFGEAFDVDWTGLDLGVHFGNEGWGLPLPWHLRNNCTMYEIQPCRVSDVVQAVETGRWPGSKLIPRPKSARVSLYTKSILQHGFVWGILLIAGLAILNR